MASTRSKNTPGNFCLEQRENRNSLHYLLYPCLELEIVLPKA